MEELINTFKVVIRRAFDFNGRSSLREYWMFIFAVVLIKILLRILAVALPILGILSTLFGVLVLIPSISVTARRLHDINKSGWWLFIWCIPLIGWIIGFIWSLRDGDKGSNAYGADPLGDPKEASGEVPAPVPEQHNPFNESEAPKENPFKG